LNSKVKWQKDSKSRTRFCKVKCAKRDGREYI
jgi:hypothetical protein